MSSTGGALSGGTVSSAGGALSGGTVSSAGGAPSTGGGPSTGGANGIGGTASTDVISSGGVPSTGGLFATGGSIATGGCGTVELDPDNCGTCGHTCLGGLCSAGKCLPTEIAAGLTDPSGLAISAEYVYVRDDSFDGSVKRLDVSGVLPPTVLASGFDRLSSLALSGNLLYFGSVNYLNGTDVTGQIAGFATATSAVVYQVSVEGDAVYWLEATTGSTVFMRAPAGGATGTLMGSIDAGLGNFGVASNCIYAYTQKTDTLNAGIYKSCGDEFALVHATANTVTFSSAHASDETWLYFREKTRGIMRVPLNGAANPTLVAASSAGGPPIIDENHVYYIEGAATTTGCTTNWTLWRAPKTGKGTPEVLATALSCPNYLNMDDKSLYWSSSVDGTVVRLAK